MNPFTSKVLAVMRREFMQRVKTKWFLVSTLGIPLLMVGMMVLAGVFISSAQEAEEVVAIGVIDASGRIGDLMVEEMLADSILASRVAELDEATEQEVRRALPQSDYDVFVRVPADVVEGGEDPVRIFGRDNVLDTTTDDTRDALRRALLRARLAESGVEEVNAERLLAYPSMRTVTVSASGEARSQEMFQAISLLIAFFFYMILLIYGQMIIRSVIEEKASDIVEVMVSSLRPWELMLGKIVGVGAVGLAQIGVWALVLTVAGIFGLSAGAAALAAQGIPLPAFSIPWGTLSLVLLLLVLGYLLYAGMFAAAGATISNETDAQQVAFPVTMLIIVPFIAVQGIITSPNAPWAVVMSIIPFFSPLVMPPRLFLTSVPIWQVAASILVLVGCVLGAAWVAGRIYRVGILMKGQRANLPEVIRWVRHG
ncbi:MAG: ABC transporter permease [Gemmatimonadota bacterium]|nr:ABC transporter permease [Gemmatimonadota bacterium]